jgi:hypothetical protein
MKGLGGGGVSQNPFSQNLSSGFTEKGEAGTSWQRCNQILVRLSLFSVKPENRFCETDSVKMDL